METLASWVLILVACAGMGLLLLGGDRMTRGAVALALRLKVSRAVVGLTVVSVATSLPEAVTSFLSAAYGENQLILGNILGSNLCNIGMVLGLTALFLPIRVHHRLVRREAPIALAATVLFLVNCYNGLIGRLEGLVLLLTGIMYLGYITYEALRVKDSTGLEVTEGPLKPALFNLGLGTVLMPVGAHLLIQGCRYMALRWGVDSFVVGFTVMAIGTSLPELSASLIAAYRGQTDLSVGNVLGSIIFNLTLVGGGVATFFPIEASIPPIETAIHIGFGALLWLILHTEKQVSRTEGFSLILGYILSLLVILKAI